MNPGFVYILTNEAMPGLVKIGRTSRDVDLRASELWQTGVPEKFNVFWSCKTPDCVQLEAYVHGDLHEKRVSRSREFFRIDELEAKKCLRFWADIQAKQWIDNNFDEHSAVHISLSIAGLAIEEIAKEENVGPSLVADALSQVSLDELRPALARVINQKRQDQIDSLKRACIPESDWGGLIND